MTAQGRYNDYKRYCTELGFFREVVETTTGEDGAELSRTTTMCYCNIQDCNRALVKRDKGGYSTMGSRAVKKRIDILRIARDDRWEGGVEKKASKSSKHFLDLDHSAPVYSDKAAHNHSGWIDLIINENYIIIYIIYFWRTQPKTQICILPIKMSVCKFRCLYSPFGRI